MPVISAAQHTLLRMGRPHTSEHYLAVLKPASLVSAKYGGGTNTGAVFTAQVDSITVDADTAVITEITYKNKAGQWQDADQHFTLWVGNAAGSQAKGRVRLRKNTNATKLFPAACNHIDFQTDDWLTVYPYVEPTIRLQRLEYDPGPPEVLTMHKDWDVAYSDQNLKLYPVPMMGPTGAAELVAGTATVYFNGSASYGMGGATIADGDHDWEFPGGTPATYSGAVPGNVTWAAEGQYVCSLTVVDSNLKTTKTYRTIFIGDFYLDFTWEELSGTLDQRGWRGDFEVFADADINEFAEGTMVALVTKEWYGATLRSFGGNRTGRHNIRYVGWIVKDTTVKDPETSTVRFGTVGPLGVLKEREPSTSVMLNDVAGSPTTWYELKDLTVRKGLHHFLYWHTTLFFMTDANISSDLSAKLYERDFARADSISALTQFLEQTHTWWGADRTGCVYFEEDPDLLASPDDNPAPRNAVPTTITLGHPDWQDELTFAIEETKKCNFLEIQGVYYTGGADQDNCTFLISYSPGRAVDYFGSGQSAKGHTMPSTQAASNKLVGLVRAKINNPVPSIPITFAGNYAIFDIVPVHWTKLNVAAADTRRGIVWTAQRMLPNQITERLDSETGSIEVKVDFSKEAYGPAGVTGDYPSDEEPEPTPVPPPTPVEPFPEIDDWNGIWVLGIRGQAHKPGIVRTEDLGGAATSVPVWATWTTGIDMVNYPYCRGLERDPWHPNTRVYALMHDTSTEFDYGLVLYRRVYSSGAWGSWTAILNETIIETVLGYAINADSGYISRPGININAEGHIYVMVTVERTSDGWLPQYFFKSTDYGATWSAVRMQVQPENSPQCEPMCCVVGMLKGASGHNAGQVIYCGYRQRSTFHYPTVCASTDGGVVWTNVAGGTSVDQKGTRIQIDPNDQDIFYTIDRQESELTGPLWKYTGHGAAGAVVAAFGNVTRPALCKVGLATTMHAAAQTVLKVSTDGGTSVTSIAVTGNIASAGIPLNWDWNLLMALHSLANGIAVTKAIQISPDGGTTWYDKTGNIDNDWPNCSGAVNVGFCLDD